jgi:hypothetical protein
MSYSREESTWQLLQINDRFGDAGLLLEIRSTLDLVTSSKKSRANSLVL